MFKKVQNGSGPGGDDAAPKGDDPGQRASQGPPQRCGALRRTLARPAPDLRVLGRLGAVQGPKRYLQRYPYRREAQRTAESRCFSTLFPCYPISFLRCGDGW